MNARRVSVCALIAWAATYAPGQNAIVQWNAGVPGSAYAVLQGNAEIIILTGGYDFKFYAVDPSHETGLGVINNITIAPTCTGSFTILIDNETAGLSGARAWAVADLRHPNRPTDTCTVAGIDVIEAVLRYAPPPPASEIEHIFCDAITGDINIGTLAPVRPGNPLARKIEAGVVTANIYIENFRGDLDFESLTGNITTGTGGGEYTPGDITIRSAYSGTIHHTDSGLAAGYSGHTKILGDFSGKFIVDNRMFGVIEIGSAADPVVTGNLVCGVGSADQGMIDLRGYVSRGDGSSPPNVLIHGSITGSAARTAPAIDTYYFNDGFSGLDGTIAIDGSLSNAILNGPEIKFYRIFPSRRGAIAIDYDGWDAGDDWDPDATILGMISPTVPDATYSGNRPDKFVYEITPCIGDLNNDGLISGGVNGADWIALNEARLLHLSGGAYRDCFVDHYAGLEGSVAYHGNLDGLPTPGTSIPVDCADLRWLEHFVDPYPCCLTDTVSVRVCRADFDRSGSVGISDLSAILSKFGLCESDAGYDSTYDFDYADCPAVTGTGCSTSATTGPELDCIDISDLSTFLSTYGYDCSCFTPPPGAAFSGDQADRQGEDPDFVAWVRQASYDELMAWYADWVEGRDE